MHEDPGEEVGEAQILVITRNQPPLRGGMERLNCHLAIELARRFHVEIIGPAGSPEYLPSTIGVTQVPPRPLWRFFLTAMRKTWKLARRSSPQVALAGSGLTAPLAVLAARLGRGRSVVYAHGLDLVAQHFIYRALWLPFVRCCDLCLVNSNNTARLAREAGVPAERVAVLHPGVTLPSTVDASDAAADFRRRHGLQNAEIILSVGRLTPRKGLREFVQYALPIITQKHTKAVLLVIGDEAPNALKRVGSSVTQRLMLFAHEHNVAEHVRVLGPCDEDELTAAYQAAELSVFPLKEVTGDVEGFGMVAIEAAAHGLPTVAFDVGGVRDAVAHGQSGWLVPAGNYVQMNERVVQALEERRTDAVRSSCRTFANAFTWPRFGYQLSEKLRLIT